MAVEARRGCGYRKAGGLYITSAGIGEPCERLPIPIAQCPVCQHAPVARTRGPQWVGAQFVFGMALPCHEGDAQAKTGHHGHCPLCNENRLLQEGDPKDKFMLLWIGEEHYPTPRDWSLEAAKMGASRRISSIPKGFVIGKSYVLVAHPKAVRRTDKVKAEGDLHETENETCHPGIFHGFCPQAVELIVTPSMKKQKWVRDLVDKKGVRLVEVPENDPDHAATLTKKSKRKQAMERHARKLAPKTKPEPDGREEVA